LGFSCSGVADGTLAQWLASHAVAMAGTWNDSTQGNQAAQASVSGEYGNWTGALDDAIGGIFEDDTWQQAAAGEYDARWTAAVTSLKRAWGTRDQSRLYVRFAHEFNLEGSQWRVTGADAEDFKHAWQRFHRILKGALPKASLVWCPNDGTSGSLDLDVRDAYPGDAYVDIVAIDTYNAWPWVDKTSAFESKLNGVYANGAPLGAESWRRWAEQRGKPLAIGEWANGANADQPGGGGDSPFYIQRFHDWLVAHAGAGAGQIRYAIYFNCWDQYRVFPDTLQPQTAAMVRQLF
jgi:hypothetical protein